MCKIQTEMEKIHDHLFFQKSNKCQTNIATISYTIRPDDLDFRGITCKAEVGDKKITYSSVSGLESEPFRTVTIVHHRIVRLYHFIINKSLIQK